MSAPRPRVIGLLGGMSWESSAEYYRLANEDVRERLGGLHSARLVLTSLDFADVLATAFTMEQDFYRERLAQHGLAVVTPSAPDRAVVHRITYDELCRGVVREESREVYRAVIARLAERGAEGVILGCTEIKLLVGQADSPVPVFPSTRLPAAAAVAAALGEPAEGTSLTQSAARA